MTGSITTIEAEARPEVPDGRIVVGVDGSEASKRALRWAQFLAETTGGHVEAVMVWQSVPSYAWAGAFWGSAPGEQDPAAIAAKILTATVDEVFGATRPAALQAVEVEGGASEVLLSQARGARMLVVGSRGHGGFAGLLLGSVSSACAEHATCPVLVIHGTTPPPS